jgi:hypothetical protein
MPETPKQAIFLSGDTATVGDRNLRIALGMGMGIMGFGFPEG